MFDPPSNDDGPSSSQVTGSLFDLALHHLEAAVENMFAVQALIFKFRQGARAPASFGRCRRSCTCVQATYGLAS